MSRSTDVRGRTVQGCNTSACVITRRAGKAELIRCALVAVNTITPASSCQVAAQGSCSSQLSAGTGTTELLKKPHVAPEGAPRVLSARHGRSNGNAAKTAVSREHAAASPPSVLTHETDLRRPCGCLLTRGNVCACMNHLLKAQITPRRIHAKPPKHPPPPLLLV